MTYRPGGDSFVARVRERDERVFRDGWPAGLLPSGRNCYNDRDRTVPRDCPANLGPWGAWRAVVGHYIHPVIAEWDVCAIRDQDEPSLYLILSDSEVFDAVGWSP